VGFAIICCKLGNQGFGMAGILAFLLSGMAFEGGMAFRVCIGSQESKVFYRAEFNTVNRGSID